MKLPVEIASQISAIFEKFILGEFESEKDSFFEALAKSINQINELNEDNKIFISKEKPGENVTSKKLRKLCYKVYEKNAALVAAWHADEGGKENYFLIKFDTNECKILDKNLIPGRPNVEGRMLVQAGLDALCIIESSRDSEALEPVLAYFIIDKVGYKRVFKRDAELLLDKGNIPFLVVHNNRYVPLLRKQLQQQNQLELGSAAATIVSPPIASTTTSPAAARTVSYTTKYRISSAAASRPVSPFFASTAASPAGASETIPPSSVTAVTTSPVGTTTAITASPVGAAEATTVSSDKRSRMHIEDYFFTVAPLTGGEIVCRMECRTPFNPKTPDNTKRSLISAFKRAPTKKMQLFALATSGTHNFIELRQLGAKSEKLTKDECRLLVKAYYEKLTAHCMAYERVCPPIQQVFKDENNLLELETINIDTSVVEEKQSKKRKRDDGDAEAKDTLAAEEAVSESKRHKPTVTSSYGTRSSSRRTADNMEEDKDETVVEEEGESMEEEDLYYQKALNESDDESYHDDSPRIKR